MLFHYTEQPLLWHDVNQTLCRPVKLFVYWPRFLAWRDMIKWHSSVYEASWSRKVHLREVSGKCKYLKMFTSGKRPGCTISSPMSLQLRWANKRADYKKKIIWVKYFLTNLYERPLLSVDLNCCYERYRNNRTHTQTPAKHHCPVGVRLLSICYWTQGCNTEQPNKLKYR